jgi:hypothetical protein
MDFYRELEKIDRKVPLRKHQEFLRYYGKPDDQKFPYRNTARKSVGEYFASIDDKIKVI